MARGTGSVLILFAFMMYFFSQKCEGKIIEVCPEATCKVHSIQQAINMAENGDTVYVGGGFYYEGNLKLNKSIFLWSDENAVIDGQNKFETLTITVPNVKVQGFCFQNTGRTSIEDIAAIHIDKTHNISIINNRIENAFFGILSEGSNTCRIEKNQISGIAVDENVTGNGIHNWKCDSMQILSNSISGHRDGIYMEFVSNSTIAKNKSTGNLRYGLHFMFSNNDLYEGNTFQKNGAGVAVMFSKHVDMYNNLFADNWGSSAFGLLLKEISGGNISGNIFKSNTTGAFFEGSAKLKMHKNQFLKNGWAFKIQASCEDIQMDSNNFIGNTFDIATNGTLVLNTFENNYWDKYQGYDLSKDGIGDVPYQPVSLYSMITEKNPTTLLLMRSFLTDMLDKAEKVIPSITPEKLKDNKPLMKPVI